MAGKKSKRADRFIEKGIERQGVGFLLSEDFGKYDDLPWYYKNYISNLEKWGNERDKKILATLYSMEEDGFSLMERVKWIEGFEYGKNYIQQGKMFAFLLICTVILLFTIIVLIGEALGLPGTI